MISKQYAVAAPRLFSLRNRSTGEAIMQQNRKTFFILELFQS